jgi:hypothetical protein
MKKPKIGKPYVFVRLQDGQIEHTEFIRHEDGSAGFLADRSFHVYENHPDAWKGALEELEQLGFLEMQEAKDSGMVPMDWQPTSESSAMAKCKGPIVASDI